MSYRNGIRNVHMEPVPVATARENEEDTLLWFADSSSAGGALIRRSASSRQQRLSLPVPTISDSITDAKLSSDGHRIFALAFGDSLACITGVRKSDYSWSAAGKTLALHEGTIVRRHGWVMTASAQIDSGVLLTFSETTSDRRVVARLNNRCELIKSVVISEPIAFIAASSTSKKVLAARNINGPELLVYSWTWGADRSKRQPQIYGEKP